MSSDEIWRPASADPPAADEVDGYRELTEVARGGDSVVYRARQISPSRDVAIKVLRIGDPENEHRFRRELELTVALGRQHPNIVTVLATGTTARGFPAIVMDFYELGSLHDRLCATGPLPGNDVVAAGTVIADALAFAHGKGILHRDVKPQNILTLPTSYLLADFGIARLADASHTSSAERFSYRHASPQTLDGKPPSVGDDIWSLGSTLFTLLDGRPPYASDDPDEDTALAYLRRVHTSDPRPLTRDDIPPQLAEVVNRCLQRDPADRYVDAAAVHAALQSVPTEARAWVPGTPAPEPAPPPADPTPDGSSSGRSDSSEPAQSAWAPQGSTGSAPAAPPQLEAPAPPSAAPATSALGHLNSAGDDEFAVTGRWRPPTPDKPDEEPAADEEPPRKRSKKVLAVLGTAIVVGVALGVIGTLLRSGDSEDPPPQGSQNPTEAQVPILTETLPPQTGPAQPDFSDPALAPEIVRHVDNGTSVRLEWSDPSNGEARFTVLDANTRKLVRQTVPGITKAAVEGVDPDAARVCYVVMAVLDDRVGVSEANCVNR